MQNETNKTHDMTIENETESRKLRGRQIRTKTDKTEVSNKTNKKS